MKFQSHINQLQQELSDTRSRSVFFIAHCILNENTRYLGGACTQGIIGSILNELQSRGVGVVQMPCPEQIGWGGVLKKWLLLAYSLQSQHSFLYHLRGLIIPVFHGYTRFKFRHIAKWVVKQIKDYQKSKFNVIGIIGIDGSPSCGVKNNLNLRNSFEYLAKLPSDRYYRDKINQEIYAKCLTDGPGFFITALQQDVDRN
jgi:predicted secreted protein